MICNSIKRYSIAGQIGSSFGKQEQLTDGRKSKPSRFCLQHR